MSLASVNKAEIKLATGHQVSASRINKADWMVNVHEGDKHLRRVIIRTSEVETLIRVGGGTTTNKLCGIQQIPTHRVAPIFDALSSEATEWLKQQATSGNIVLGPNFDVSDINSLVRRLMLRRIRAHSDQERLRHVGRGFKKPTRVL